MYFWSINQFLKITWCFHKFLIEESIFPSIFNLENRNSWKIFTLIFRGCHRCLGLLQTLLDSTHVHIPIRFECYAMDRVLDHCAYNHGLLQSFLFNSWLDFYDLHVDLYDFDFSGKVSLASSNFKGQKLSKLWKPIFSS